MPFHNSDVIDDPAQWVRQESFGGGVNSFTRPSRIGDEQVVQALNIMVDQSSRAQTRPGADSLGGVALGAGSLVQALAYYDTPDAEQLLACVGNSFFAWNAVEWGVALAGYTATASSTPEIVQGINELLIVDGTQNVFAWDGTDFTDLGSGAGEPPAGASIVAWHTYRAWYAGMVNEPDAIYISDIAAPGTVQNPQFVTRVGEGEGEAITALLSSQGYWLVVFKENSIWMINAEPTATAASGWLYSKVTGGVGCVGKRAAVRYGNDIFFMARDGVRTLRRMASVEGQYEVMAPLSQSVQDVIDRINWNHADKIAAGTFDQFVFFALPLDDASEPSHTLVWNGRLGAWMQLWDWAATVFEVSRFADDMQLVFGNGAGRVRAWKFDADRRLDATFLDDGAGIDSQLTTKAWDFGDPISRKETWKMELRFVQSTAAAQVELLLDGESVANWAVDTDVPQNELPVDLPFDLATDKPRRWVKGLGKKKFNELQLRVSSASGRLSLETLSLAAFMDTYR